MEMLSMPTVTALPTIGPSPTPFTHVVKKDDTLLGIAIRYGVSLEELLAANPGINPTILSIGQQIIIPGPEGDSASAFLPEATPVPIEPTPVTCYRTPADSLWCLTAIRNEGPSELEGISVIIMLFDQDGNQLASSPAYGPINLLPVGRVMPLAVNFPAHAPEYAIALAQPMTAFYASHVDERYVNVEVKQRSDKAGAGKRDWQVNGQLELGKDLDRKIDRIVLLGIAVDDNGQVVGFRKWKAGGDFAPGEAVPFEIVVNSLGPAIDHVEILVEASLASSEEG
jgi:LysM repeat protein